MMMREVSLNRIEELLLGVAAELRPALAASDPSVPVLDRGDVASVFAVRLVLMVRPVENVCVRDPGGHAP